jgi:hydroxymethylpyrimidine/phosphomethylpyrimidine kinase
VALTIAGSDSGAGAGIQADLKTMVDLGVYGLTAVTAITAQNTLGVRTVFPLPPSILQAQLETLFADFQPRAIKIGMLGQEAHAALVTECLRSHPEIPVVWDPVGSSTQGQTPLLEGSLHHSSQALCSVTQLMTPNLGEWLTLIQEERFDPMRLEGICHQWFHRFPRLKGILLKGGHLKGHWWRPLEKQARITWHSRSIEDMDTDSTQPPIVDVLVTADSPSLHLFCAPSLTTRHSHGTGCTLSAAIAAFWAQGLETVTACRLAKQYVTRLLTISSTILGPLGAGQRPMAQSLCHARAMTHQGLGNPSSS